MSSTVEKENNSNTGNTTQNREQHGGRKFILNNLQGKIFDVSSQDAIHQFAETVKAIADYMGQEYTHRDVM